MEYALNICNSLHDDHMKTVSMLEDLEAALKRIGRNNPPAADDADVNKMLDDLVAVMDIEITSHFRFEEEHLFPRAEQMGGGHMLMILRDEHDTIRPLAARIAELIEVPRENGFDAETWAKLYDLGLELAERETFHIQKEEMAFIPMLSQIIDPSDDEALTKTFLSFK
ncbi:MAG: hemerythrin domain-containing protein [Magnetovibrio sp.]|nr:hemerythrin domain-containing protein [Magnetovibrio sp.]